MKKTIKSLISMLLIGIIVCSICTVNVFAANTIISFNKKSVSVGESVTVTITFNAGEAMYGVTGIVNYDSQVLEYKTGNAVGSAGTLKIVESPSGETKTSYSLTFTAKSAGNCSISVSDCSFSGQTTDKGLSGASASVTVKDKTLSDNANLKSMYLTAGSLSPAFSPNVTTYEVTVKNSVTECKISAKAADSNATVSVEGSSTLKVGKNTRTVVVTAPSGTTKRYTVNITRSETDDEVKPETPVETNPLEIDVDGAKMLIATDISSVKMFNGFTATQADYGDSKVAVAVDENAKYTIYYLKALDNDILTPYIYDAKTATFIKLQYFTQGENTYIFADIPNNKTISSDFYTTNAQIAGMNVKCYASSGINMSDFYYIYCYSGNAYGFYRYDSRENVIQRYPELMLEEIKADKEKEDSDFIDRFLSLSLNAKLIVASIAFVALAIIVLIVIVIVKLINNNRYDDFDASMISDEDFEDITIESFSTSKNLNNHDDESDEDN